MIKRTHLVALNIPFPPDYGGAIDIFYKVKALHQIGVEVILHCFKYGRSESSELEKYCSQVFYYNRKKRFVDFLSKRPFIVKTRNHPELLANLLKDPAPIIFDGLHTCFHLSNKKLAGIPKIVRTHNIEHEYYNGLRDSEKSPFKRFFFQQEAKKLKSFEVELKHAQALACISPQDTLYFSEIYGKAHFIPAFHPYSKILSKPGRGDYILFHGNLSVPENIKALHFIFDDLLADSNHRLLVAGKGPSENLKSRIAKNQYWKLFENPTQEKMDELIREAHICLIPTFQSTGLKLKLLASLFAGRFVLTNTEMVKNTGLENLCQVGKSAAEIRGLLNKLMAESFSQEEIEKRSSVLNSNFNNERLAGKLMGLIT